MTMKRIFLFLVMAAAISIASAQPNLDKAIKTFENTVGSEVQKTMALYGTLVDFSYFDQKTSKYTYLTVKTIGSIVCTTSDCELDEYPNAIKNKIQALYPKEMKKGQIDNFRMGADPKNAPIYAFVISTKDDDTLVIMNKIGTILYKYDMPDE